MTEASAIKIVRNIKTGEFEAWYGLDGYAEGWDLIRVLNLKATVGDVIYPFINGLDRRLTVTAGPC